MKLSQSYSPDHLFLTLIEGVHAIHLPGHIHNDVKPNNTMVEVRGLSLITGFRKASPPLHKGMLQIITK